MRASNPFEHAVESEKEKIAIAKETLLLLESQMKSYPDNEVIARLYKKNVDALAHSFEQLELLERAFHRYELLD